MNPLAGQNLLRIATFIMRLCVKKQSFQIYFNFSSGGVIFLASHFTRFNSNPTGKVSGSSVDHFLQTSVSVLSFPCSINQLQIDQCIAKNVHQTIERIAQSTDQGVSSNGLNLYQTSFLSHFLSIGYTVLSILHFFAPTVYRTNAPACTKMHFLGVFAVRTPSIFVLFCIKVLGARFRILFPIRFVQILSLDHYGELEP